LPPDFNYVVISRQGMPMHDGNLTPGIFDGMGAFPGPHGTTILIRNHENRDGEQRVIVPEPYDATVDGGNTKLAVRRERAGVNAEGQQVYNYEIVDSFAILGGTSTNCAGGAVPFHKWITCEEVVKGPTFGPAPPSARGPTARKHGYLFEVDATVDRPVAALPIIGAGRFSHEATAWQSGILYETEDRNNRGDGGSCFYRYIPDRRVGQSGNLAETNGVLQALKLQNELRANMDAGRVVGVPYDVEWVTIDEPDHDDDTDRRIDRVPGSTPVRFQAQDKGAAVFDREEGMWVGTGKVFFDCTEGGPLNLGQVWEYDPGRETITLIYESSNSAALWNPDNVVIVPQTGDIFLCEDSPNNNQYVRGLTQRGEIYNFAQALTNASEFCGACFDPDGQTLYLNQQGGRGSLPGGPANRPAVTYAIYGPFEKREGSRSRNFGNGPRV
jgi:secreted PhoX family phosphatase